MALSQRQRQRKLEKRKNKRRAAKKPATGRVLSGFAGKISPFSRCPVVDCRVQDEIWDVGIGQVLISRAGTSGVAFAAFLVDRYCLGVKNAFANVADPSEYRDRILGRLTERYKMSAQPPAYARKLVEDAVDYARGFGIAPHRDYRAAKQIFGDIDPADCSESFEFGYRGKPLFVAGPYDPPERCRQILSMLEYECGPDGFDFRSAVFSGEDWLEDDLPEVDAEDDDMIALEGDDCDVLEDGPPHW